MITVNNVTLTYEGKTVLKNFSAQMDEREISCLVGESGFGKTSLINAMLGFLPLATGGIQGVPERLSVVFQEDRLFEDFTVIENLKLFAPPEKIADALARCGLPGEEKTKVHELSGGMKRRVAIIRAVLCESDYIIMDEPFSGIDAENKRKTALYICANLNGRGLFFTTHNEEDKLLFPQTVLTAKEE